MFPVKIQICQLKIKLSMREGLEIENREEMENKVQKCLSIIPEKNPDFVVFPEFYYIQDLDSLYSQHSENRVIVAGSHINENRYNETVVFVNGNKYSYNKVYLSPYETSLDPDKTVIPSDNNLLILKYKNVNFAVLTCQDYFENVRNIATSRLEDEALVDLVFSPSLNNNLPKFYHEAQATHDKRAGFYSIICNNLLHGDQGYAGSSVFGLFDRPQRDLLNRLGHRDSNFPNMICTLHGGEKIAIIELNIQYSIYPRSTMEYKPNPISYKEYNL